MQHFQHLQAPLQHLDTVKGVELWLKREDLIHPHVSGNKWRKLKYYLQDVEGQSAEAILTFGGAFSNHLAATAAMGAMAGISTHALVRGEEVVHNSTLDFCRAQGMQIEAISRKRYALKDEPAFLRSLREALPGVYLIPEGGKGPLGVKGCTEILDDLTQRFEVVAVCAGTGTTATGLLLHEACPQLLCFSALKGGGFLQEAIRRQLLDYQHHFSTSLDEEKRISACLVLEENYHFGGYGKVQPELINFMNGFYENYGVALDPVYTGKMLFGLMEKIKRGDFAPGTKILALHTGGLQGISGMNERLQKRGLKITYEA
jgi:1-aminocyclopropane-1-carboxylate deaminase/D-cysteine desulfhydrase-like pyridoxal-dependent ACC family enzyme